MQETAAVTGRYGAMIQLDYPSSVVKSAVDGRLREDLVRVLTATRPCSVPVSTSGRSPR